MFDLDAVSHAGLCGVTLGTNLPCGDLDRATLPRLPRPARELGWTRVRAIDLIVDPVQAPDQAIELGLERVLTSGGGDVLHGAIGRETRAEIVSALVTILDQAERAAPHDAATASPPPSCHA